MDVSEWKACYHETFGSALFAVGLNVWDIWPMLSKVPSCMGATNTMTSTYAGGRRKAYGLVAAAYFHGRTEYPLPSYSPSKLLRPSYYNGGNVSDNDMMRCQGCRAVYDSRHMTDEMLCPFCDAEENGPGWVSNVIIGIVVVGLLCWWLG